MKKRKLITTLRRHMRRQIRLCATDIRGGYVGGILLVTISVFVTLLSGSPYKGYPPLWLCCNLPPLIIIELIHFTITFAMGFSCGLILCEHRCHPRDKKYRAGMLFVILSTLYMTVPSLLFRHGLPWIALLVLLIVSVLSLLLTMLFYSIRRLCGAISLAFFCWITYLVILMLSCLLRL